MKHATSLHKEAVYFCPSVYGSMQWRSILTDKCELEHLYQREIHPSIQGTSEASKLASALLGPGDDDGHKTGAVITVDTRVLNDGAQSDNQNALGDKTTRQLLQRALVLTGGRAAAAVSKASEKL